jgi:hypothetical protein
MQTSFWHSFTENIVVYVKITSVMMINEMINEIIRADYFQIWCRNGEKRFFFENSTFEIAILSK